MVYATPKLPDAMQSELEALDHLRKRLGRDTSSFSPWLGTLRRTAKAKAVTSSVSIEGFEVSAEEAAALLNAEARPDEGDDDRMAFACYAHAMDHVGVMATDPVFRWSDRVVLDLHFDACHFQKARSPGHWRKGPIEVTAARGGTAFRGPDAGAVPDLMAEVVERLEHGDAGAHPVVRAAMGHLNVVSVHPFRDGNGRIARIVQSLVLARDGLVSPEFGSIEEFLADHTPEYYSALQDAQGGSYQPERDATTWVGFCIEAHLAQAGQRLRETEQAAARWTHLEELAGQRSWPDRLVVAMEQSLAGGTDSATYRREAEISAPTASADFRRLLDAGLTEQRGKGRSTRYVASDRLRDLVAP